MLTLRRTTVTECIKMGAKSFMRSPHHRMRRHWQNASVRRKFLSVVFVSLLVCVPPMVVAVALQVHLRSVRAETNATATAVSQIEALEQNLTAAQTAVSYYAILTFDEPSYIEDFQATADAIPGQIAALREQLPAGMSESMQAVEAASVEFLDQARAVVGYASPVPLDDNPSDDAIINQREPNLLDVLLAFTRATERAHDQTQDLSQLLNQRLDGNRADFDRVESNLFWATLVSLAVALAAVAVGAVAVTASIVRRIERLSENGKRFLRGEPLLPTGNSSDEIGVLTNNIGFVAELLDQRRREAVAATRAKDEFLWRVSHELRTPLTAIIGFGQLLEEEDLSPENLDSARRIVSAGEHLLALINELLDIAKIETGHLDVTLEPVPIEPLATETMSLVRSMAQARSLRIACECPEHVVMADRRRLAQVLINLLTNAVKYNSQFGSVVLAAGRRDDVVRISVTDTGPGISTDDLDLLFRPYERLDAKDSGIEGSGIGLALTKRLVEAMAGVIGVDTAIGEGTTFWFELPLAAETGQPGDAAPTDAGTDAHTGQH